MRFWYDILILFLLVWFIKDYLIFEKFKRWEGCLVFSFCKEGGMMGRRMSLATLGIIGDGDVDLDTVMMADFIVKELELNC